DGFCPFTTLIVDLQRSEDDLFADFSRNNRYKIKRALREDLNPLLALSPSSDQVLSFADYFDKFARQKKLRKSNRPKLLALGRANALILSSVTDPSANVLCRHAYVSDPSLKRARLLYSASHYRELAESADRNLVGRAN